MMLWTFPGKAECFWLFSEQWKSFYIVLLFSLHILDAVSQIERLIKKKCLICSINKVKLREHATYDLSRIRTRPQPDVFNLCPLLIQYSKHVLLKILICPWVRRLEVGLSLFFLKGKKKKHLHNSVSQEDLV